MLFRQMFDSNSSTFSYLLADRSGGEAIIIDPVLEKVEGYLKLMEELNLCLVKAVDTHLHADHLTGLGELRNRTHCITVMGQQSKVDVVSMRIEDGDRLEVGEIILDVLYTPGHTDDSYCFLLRDRIFTGDTLLIRGTGRTDFQNGNARAQYASLQRLLTLPEGTLVFPAHDYKGDTVSTIGEEKRFNPRLQVKGADEYVALMASLNLPNPKMMDVVVPANINQGFLQAEIARRGWSICSVEAKTLIDNKATALIDLREHGEREKNGIIPGSFHVPFGSLRQSIAPGGALHDISTKNGMPLLFYCAFGERSAMAVLAAQEAGFSSARHLEGGLGAWRTAYDI